MTLRREKYEIESHCDDNLSDLPIRKSIGIGDWPKKSRTKPVPLQSLKTNPAHHNDRY